jgi:peptide-methionine (S)-S-oxide reductase
MNKYFSILVTLICSGFYISSCGQSDIEIEKKLQSKLNTTSKQNMEKDTAQIVLGGGCFWCVEAQYQILDGVIAVESGYAGGKNANPTYKEVCTGTTNHAEVIKVTYLTSKLSIEDILYAFYTSHDPTTLNKQGNDVGTQYRSVLFYTTDDEKTLFEKYKKELNDQKTYNSPIVTTIEPLTVFYPAETYHQNYYNDNSSQPYCTFVVRPKVEHFKKVFANKLKQ